MPTELYRQDGWALTVHRLRSAVAAVRVLSAQRLLDRAAELLGRERLDKSCGKHHTELGELKRGRGDTGANEWQRWIDNASSLSEHHAGRRRRLDHQYIRALQLPGGEGPDKDGFVTEASDHALKQSPDILVRLADKYLCHVSMINQACEILGGRTV
jgi:hypothetical protein